MLSIVRKTYLLKEDRNYHALQLSSFAGPMNVPWEVPLSIFQHTNLSVKQTDISLKIDCFKNIQSVGMLFDSLEMELNLWKLKTNHKPFPPPPQMPQQPTKKPNNPTPTNKKPLSFCCSLMSLYFLETDCSVMALVKFKNTFLILHDDFPLPHPSCSLVSCSYCKTVL